MNGVLNLISNKNKDKNNNNNKMSNKELIKIFTFILKSFILVDHNK
jgi:hypothetical protein